MAARKRTIEHTHLGTHVIAELFGCQRIEDTSFVRRVLKEAAKQCGATVLHEKFHKFSPQGLTGYLLLAESHISIHTWPEHDYAAVDVFTCGRTMNPEAAVEYIKRELCASSVTVRRIERG